MTAAGARHAIVTGANGYIGAAVVDRLLACGWRVTILGRGTSRHVSIPSVAWRLGEAAPDRLFPAHAVIHLAHDWTDAADRNIDGSAKLLDAARRHKATRFVFASTISAQADALNRYGRTKAAIESLLDRPGETAARIGLVYGGPPHGMWGAIQALAALPIVPMVRPRQPVQPIALGEVADALVRLANGAAADRRIVVLGASAPIGFGSFLRLAAAVRGRRLTVVPLPADPIVACLDLAGRVVPRLAGMAERVRGLVGLPFRPSEEDLAAIGLRLVDPVRGLGAASRRQILFEAHLLFRSLGIRRPPLSAMMAYGRAVERLGDGAPIGLPRLARMWPPLIRLSEPLSEGPGDGRRDSLKSRLAVASLVADAAGLLPVYDYAPRSVAARLLRVVYVLAVEVAILPFRLVLGRRE